ncbi:MAG: putative PEP-binding protein, partial [Planctomycetota bacterium]
VRMVNPEHLDQLLHPMIDPKAKAKATALTKGLNAAPGAAVGKLAFTADEAEERVAAGEKVLLVRRETEPADIGGMKVCEGILTSTGGNTSHAAVVARGMGTPCVCGAAEVKIDSAKKKCVIGGKTYTDKDYLSIDGTTGEVFAGELPTLKPGVSGNFAKFMKLVNKYRKLKVRANADTPQDAQVARDYGAEGIGLCRTEHMFFDPERISAMRQMILSDTEAGRKTALDKLAPFQKKDFFELFKAMKGLPVTIRLLDPPLHEFLPHSNNTQKELAEEMGLTFSELHARVEELHEMNPMLGHRGCRLAVTYPEILRMQVRAILEAAIDCKKKKITVLPEIMIPLVGTVKELTFLKNHLEDEAKAVFKKHKTKVKYLVGTMIEVPRAAVTAEEIATEAEFFSFGTNDLTQMTFGYSRDDAGVFITEYKKPEIGILERDPFESLDTEGVGFLVDHAVKAGRTGRPGIKLGICGEHGGDPKSVHFCHGVGLDYVSCSPYRVPIALLSAAHAALA